MKTAWIIAALVANSAFDEVNAVELARHHVEYTMMPHHGTSHSYTRRRSPLDKFVETQSSNSNSDVGVESENMEAERGEFFARPHYLAQRKSKAGAPEDPEEDAKEGPKPKTDDPHGKEDDDPVEDPHGDSQGAPADGGPSSTDNASKNENPPGMFAQVRSHQKHKH